MLKSSESSSGTVDPKSKSSPQSSGSTPPIRTTVNSGLSLSSGSRRILLVVGEFVLLSLLCIPITSFEELLQAITQQRTLDPFALDWFQILLRSMLIPIACQISFAFQDLYDWRVTSNRNQTSLRLLQSIFYAGILLFLTSYVLLKNDVLAGYASNPWTIIAALVATFPASYAYRAFFHWVFSHWQLKDRLILLGDGEMAKTLEDELKHLKDPGYEIVGYVGHDAEDPRELDCPNLGPVESLREIAIRHRVNVVAVTMSERRGHLPTLDLLNCRLAGMRVEEGEQIYERLTGKVSVRRLRPSYLIFSEGFQRSNLIFTIKRLMDIILSIVGLLLLLPLCTLVAILIKLDSRGPVFYGQTRVGKEGRVFTTYKFRTMVTDAEAAGPQWAAKNDSRVTRIGAFLRKTRIDEIPQMWNVLRNEMSFVGPRPERPFFVEELRQEIPYYMERLLVKPGITGWAQINYQYGSSIEDALTKLQYDLYYIKNLSIFLDVVTLLRTVKVVVLRRGAV